MFFRVWGRIEVLVCRDFIKRATNAPSIELEPNGSMLDWTLRVFSIYIQVCKTRPA